MAEKEKKQDTFEVAKSGRSSCRGCGQAIAKGALRFGLVDFDFSESGSHRWWHPACAKEKHAARVAAALNRERATLEPAQIAELEGDAKAASPPSPAAPTVEASALPEWWVSAPAYVGKVPSWLHGLEAPALDGSRLDHESTLRAVQMLKKGGPTYAKLAAHLGPSALRDLAWAIFAAWAPTGHMGQKWVFSVLARVMDDTVALRLEPVVRDHIRKNKKPAAAAGLELLRTHGTPTSLMVVQSLAQRFTYRGSYNPALQTLQRVAMARKMTLAELEDTLVPTCGLDPQGTRVFDYGNTSYRLGFDGELRPVVITESGKRLTGLPKEGLRGDEPSKVREARAEYAKLTAEVQKMLDVQRARLERALSSGRDWKLEDWTTKLRHHPLLQHLVRRLIWGVYAPSGELVASFRIDEEDAPMDMSDARIDLAPYASDPSLRIRLVHPADLNDDERGRWGELFADYELLPPFPQMAREVVSPHPDDRGGDALHRFVASPIEQGPLHGRLGRLGWAKGEPDDHVRVRYFEKRFERAGLTAVMLIEPGFHPAGYDSEPQTPTEVIFTREAVGGLSAGSNRILLAQVGTAVISEVLHDLAALAE